MPQGYVNARLFLKDWPLIVQCRNLIFELNPALEYIVFIADSVRGYIAVKNLNDAGLASFSILRNSRWPPRWPPK